MGARGNGHRNQSRKNTPKGLSNQASQMRVSRELQRRDDAEDFEFISHVLRSTEAGFLKRKYSA